MFNVYPLWDKIRRSIPVAVRKKILSVAPWVRTCSRYMATSRIRFLPSRLNLIRKIIARLTKEVGLADFSYEDGQLYVLTPDGFKLWDNQKAVNATLWHYSRGYSHEIPERKMLLQHLKRHSIIFDIGAGCGLHSLTFARAEPTATIYAFEANPETFNTLQHNLYKNGLRGKVHCFNYVVSDRQGQRYISTAYGPLDHVRSDDNNHNAVPIQAIVLDSFIEKRALKVQGIKIDVEGHEVHVLRGARRTILKDKPWLYIEAEPAWLSRSGSTLEELEEFLRSINYAFFWVDGETGSLSPYSEHPAKGNNLFAYASL